MTSNNKVGPGVDKHIDESIRRVYQEALNQDVPDRFKQLLDQLREQDTVKQGGERSQ